MEVIYLGIRQTIEELSPRRSEDVDVVGGATFPRRWSNLLELKRQLGEAGATTWSSSQVERLSMRT